MHTKKISEENVFLPGDILCQSKKTKGPCVKKLLFKKCHKKSVEFYFMCENESTKLLIADRLTFCFCRWWNRRIVKSDYNQISVNIIITLMNRMNVNMWAVWSSSYLRRPRRRRGGRRQRSLQDTNTTRLSTPQTPNCSETQRGSITTRFKFSGWMSVRLLDGSQRDKDFLYKQHRCVITSLRGGSRGEKLRWGW